MVLLLHQIILHISEKNLLERIKKVIMKIDDKIGDVKLQYDINREAAKISVLSSGKIVKYEYLTGGEILIEDQMQRANKSH